MLLFFAQTKGKVDKHDFFVRGVLKQLIAWCSGSARPDGRCACVYARRNTVNWAPGLCCHSVITGHKTPLTYVIFQGYFELPLCRIISVNFRFLWECSRLSKFFLDSFSINRSNFFSTCLWTTGVIFLCIFSISICLVSSGLPRFFSALYARFSGKRRLITVCHHKIWYISNRKKLLFLSLSSSACARSSLGANIYKNILVLPSRAYCTKGVIYFQSFPSCVTASVSEVQCPLLWLCLSWNISSRVETHVTCWGALLHKNAMRNQKYKNVSSLP